MWRKLGFGGAFLVFLCTWAGAREVRDHLSPTSQAAWDAIEAQEDAHWKSLQPVIAEWAARGKPFIPWACKAGDLPQAGIPAFPGAEGGGMYSFGGRGGKVFVVTSLADSGPRTYREALESAGPRVVVFGVAGIIHLQTPVEIRAPYITIAGQTAPGDGICIAGPRTTDIDTHDVVIRYLRFRRGYTDPYLRDHALSGNGVGNIIVDHCSCSWGLDENISLYRHMYQPPNGGKALKLPTPDITIQWTISSEALNPQNHAFGGTWGGTNDTFHHNLLCCNTGRNCSIGMGGDFNFVNNVVFNWRHRTLDGGDDTSRVNCINNYFLPGPVTNDGAISHRIGLLQPNRGKGTEKHFGKWYVVGNFMGGDPQVTADNWDGGVQFPIENDPDARGMVEDPVQIAALMKDSRVDQPFPMAPITVQTAQDAFESVLAGAGATLPVRDSVDQRAVEETRTDTVVYTAGKGIISDISEVGGFPDYKGQLIAYPQNDGIPDWWKDKYGLDKHDPDLAFKDSNGDGYTNIEKYLDGLDPTKKIDWKDLKNNVNPLGDGAALRPPAIAQAANR